MIDSVIRKAIEARIASSGLKWIKLRQLELRPSEKTLSLDLELEGEESPLRLFARYRVEGDAVLIESLETSKKWLTELASVALAKQGGRFPLPGGFAGAMARMVL